MRKLLPTIISVVVGIVLLLDYFFHIPLIESPANEIQNWGIIVAAFALGLASVNLLRIHGEKILRKNRQSIHSATLVIALIVTSVSGIFAGQQSYVFKFAFDAIFTPLGAVFYAMTAFHLASASYRAFRARNLQAVALLVAGVLVMLGNAPIGEAIWDRFPVIADFIINVINLAGSRGILISTAIGTVGAGLRVITGIDRSHLDTGTD